jgi:DNA-binding HxlR family transcriptional regulator
VSARLRSTYGCGVELTLEVLGGYWKPVLLAHLKDGPKRYGELRRLVPRISDKMLSQRLRELVQLGFVNREEVGASRRYCLTPQGEELRPVLEELNRWGVETAHRNGIELEYERHPV